MRPADQLPHGSSWKVGFQAGHLGSASPRAPAELPCLLPAVCFPMSSDGPGLTSSATSQSAERKLPCHKKHKSQNADCVHS